MEAPTRPGDDPGAAAPSSGGDDALASDAEGPERSPPLTPSSPLDSAILDFIAESSDCIDVAETATIDLEARPDDEGLVALAFRRIHTVKGSAGLLGFATVNRLADRAETVLERIRDHELRPDPAVTSALLQVFDVMRALLGGVKAAGREAPVDDRVLDVLGSLDTFIPGGDDAVARPTSRLGDLLVSSGTVDRLEVEIAAAEQAQGDERPLGEILVDHGATGAEDIERLLARRDTGATTDNSTIRVDASLIETMFVHATALEVAVERLGGVLLGVGTDADPERARADALADVQQAAAELAATVRSTRMRPVGTLWGRLPRIARDAAHQLGKDVTFRPGGRDVLVEARVLESIVGPVIQLLRNAVDHGIERPDVRTAAGKPARGVLSVDARRENGRLLIEIADDGAGLDLEAIKAEAVERGVIGPATAATLTDETVAQLIFLPGVTTAKKANAFSGRGVGMDVVRTEVERAGGEVRVSSTPGGGTRFVLDFPDQLPG